VANLLFIRDSWRNAHLSGITPVTEETKMADVNIEIRENGPLRVTGPITITDKDGKGYSIPEGQWVSLCRCGLSEKKPFCDSAHRDGGFQAVSGAV
tara:strand:+ start:282 stop:569 length:288 start_codon:yes stop_codon:yes gene_type:complete